MAVLCKQLVVGDKQRLALCCALHVHSQWFHLEETLAAVGQGLRLAHRVRAVQQHQAAAITCHIVQIQQAFDAALDQAALCCKSLELVDPIAPFADCFFISDTQCQQRF